ncbi:MAG: hypothetical protein ABR499_19420 [Gemmatimonadaceae bacterium]
MAAGGALVLVFGLSALARRFPDVAWLQPFRNAIPQLTGQQRAKIRRRSNIYAGVELILLGLVLPMAYAALKVMFFNAFTTKEVTLVLAGSALCIGLGITAIWRRDRD